MDISSPAGMYYGRYYKNGFIYFNKYYMDQVSYEKRRHVAPKSLGQALGLGHSVSGNVLYDYTWEIYLGSQDISDYRYLWC